MLLKFEESIADLSLSRNLDESVAVENILAGIFEGRHILVASRCVLNKLFQSKELSARSKAVIKSLTNKAFEASALVERVGFFATVDPNAQDLSLTDRGFVIPLLAFKKASVSALPALVCENLVDCDIYLRAGEHYRFCHGHRGVSVRAECYGGGGTEIVKVYKRLVVERERFSLCITDSDREVVGGPLGEAARQCARIYDSASWVTRHVTLPVRELENIIPHGFFSHCDDVKRESLDVLSTIEEWFPHKIYGFLDFKGKNTLSDLMKSMPVSGFGANQWDGRLERGVRWPGVSSDCLGERNCTNPSGCTCVVFEGFGANIARTILKWLERQSVQKSTEAIAGKNEEVWRDLGQVVFEWCCAAKPTRV